MRRTRPLLPSLALTSCLAMLLLGSSPLHGEALTAGGRVTGPDGRPLAGATAELLPELESFERGRRVLEGTFPAGAISRVQSNEDGFYDLRAPEPGPYRVRLSAPGQGTVETRLILYLPEEEHPALALPLRHPTRVRVLDPEGRPVAGALVVAFDAPPEEQRRAVRGIAPLAAQVGRSDEAGALPLDHAESRALRLAALAEGYAPSEPRVSDAGKVELRLRAGRERTIEVRGRGGRPVAGALVRLGPMGLPAGLTGEDGRFTLLVPAGEELRLLVQAAGLRWAEGSVTAPEEAGEEAPPPAVLTLHEPVMIQGRVVDANERVPVAGALVWSWGQPQTAVSGRDGAYALSIPWNREGRRALAAAAAGYLVAQSPLGEDDTARGVGPTLVLLPAAAVAGVVVDEQGAPVIGALVTAAPTPEASLGRSSGRGPQQARSSRGGRFLLPALTPGGPYEVRATRPGFAPAVEEVPRLEKHQTAGDLSLVLRPGRTAFGQVLDPEERPIPGAEVALAPTSRGGRGRNSFFFSRRQPEQLPMASTDGEGRFVIEDLPAGRFDLVVRAPSFLPATVPGIEIPEEPGPVDLGSVLLEPGAALVGRVVDGDGRPLEGARLHVFQRNRMMNVAMLAFASEGRMPEAVTGVDGRFHFPGLAPGEPMEIQVRHPGHVARRLSGVEVPVPEPLEIVLEPAARVSGIVVETGGDPIFGARVTAGQPRGYGAAVHMIHAPGVEPAETGSDGRFVLEGLPGGEITLQARAIGFQDASLVHLDLAPGGEVEDVRLTLERGAAVHGRITGAAGEPLAEASVRLLETTSGFVGNTVTDGEGRYRLEGVPLGPRSFVAEHPRHLRSVRDLEVRPEDNRLDFQLAAGHRVEGRVTDTAGAPLAGSSVFLEPQRGGRQYTASTGSGGEFSFQGVEGGGYRLRARKEGFAAGGPAEPVTVAGDVSGLEVRLGAGGGIRGRVLGLTLDELNQVEVQAHSAGPTIAMPAWGRPDFEGSFLLADLAPGEWTVSAMLQGSGGGSRASETVTVTAGEEVEIELDLNPSSGFTLSGRVMLDGEPLAGSSVAAHSPGRENASFGQTDHDGRFRLENLQPGSYQLQVFSRQGGAFHRQEIELSADREVTIEIFGARLSGRAVSAAGGGPVEGVTVSLQPVEDGVSGFRPYSEGGVTDAAGTFRLKAPPGTYRLVLVKEGYARAERTVTLAAGGSIEGVEVTLSPAALAELVLAVPPGWTLPASVQVMAADAAGATGLQGNHAVGENGVVRLRSLPPGTWRVTLFTNGLAAAPVTVAVPGPPVSVSLQPPGSARVSVPALAEEGEVRVALELLNLGGERLGNTPGSSVVRGGELVLPQLVPGTWTLRLTAPDGRTWAGTLTVAPGATAVVVLR